MVWSFSGSRTFRKCQRQWFFKTHVANALAKDELRHEAYLLSKLQSVSAWRGSIVDQVLSTHVVTSLRRNQSIGASTLHRHARQLFEEQLDFARQRRIREPGMTQKAAGTAYVALQDFEDGLTISDEELDQAWSDIQSALTSFLNMHDLIQMLRRADYLVSQRALSFSYNSTSLRMVPDLIAFFPTEPPTIIDWKVHAYGMQNYRLQLASYAIALTQCKPHVDFPETLSQYSPQDVRLLEVQLLTQVQRQYSLTDADVEATYSFIARSAREMSLAVDGNKVKTLTPLDFPVTLDPEECQRCPFRSLCWEYS